MTRRPPLILAGVVAVAFGACNSTPPASPLSDPKEILVGALEAVQAAGTFHFEADVSGSIALGLGGQGAGAPLDLTGTTAEGEVDVAGGNARVAFSTPALLGLSGEVISIGDDSYLKISLFGDAYQKFTRGPSDPIGALGDPQQTIADLRTALDELPAPPTKAPDEKCGDSDCYRVSVELSNIDLGGLLGAPDSAAQATLDAWVRTDDLRPAKLAIVADSGSDDALTVTIELTRWDEPVSISAPPADQVVEGSLGP